MIKKIKQLRERIYQGLNEPKTKLELYISYGLLALIFLTIFVLAFEFGYPEQAVKYIVMIRVIQYLIVLIFSIEYLVRVVVTPKPLKYIFSFGGAVDLLSILPTYISIFFGANPILAKSQIFRSLRLLRFFRALKLMETRKKTKSMFKQSIFMKVFPYLVVMFIIKVVIFLLETKGFWINIEGLETAFGVVGFAIGLILSQKLGIAYNKIIAVEDSILKIAGILENLKFQIKGSKLLSTWLDKFIKILEGEAQHIELQPIHNEIGQTIDKTELQVSKLILYQEYRLLSQEKNFVLNRAVIETPDAYDSFLKRVTILYSIFLIIFLPGYIGLISVLIAAFVLGGMYMLIQDMDKAIDYGHKNLVNADISRLRELQLTFG